MKFFEGTKHCQYVRRGDDWECLHKLSLGVLFFNERFFLCLSQCFQHFLAFSGCLERIWFLIPLVADMVGYLCYCSKFVVCPCVLLFLLRFLGWYLKEQKIALQIPGMTQTTEMFTFAYIF